MKRTPPLVFTALVSLALIGGAHAAEFRAAIGKQGRGRCHMDSCDFFKLDSALPIKSTAHGTLYAVAYQAWSAEYKRTDDDHEYDHPPISVDKPTARLDLIFCSKTRPVIFDYYESGWHAAALRPGDESAVFGFNESAYLFYYAACHGYITEDPVSKTMAARLGYRFAESPLENGKLPDLGNLQPLDVLK